MPVILYKSLGELLPSVLKKLQTSGYQVKESSPNINGEEIGNADVFIIGPEEEHIVKLVQEVNAADKFISTIVLTWPTSFAKTKQLLQFSPFIGKNSLCVSYTETLNLQQTINSAALRTQQRRSFNKINQKFKTAAATTSAPVRIDNLGIFLEQAPIGALLIDEQDSVIAINPRARRIFNIKEDKNYVLKDFFPTLSLLYLKNSLSNISDTRTVEVNGLALEMHISEVRNEDGKKLFILLFNDVTEHKKKEAALAESEALFRFMAEAMPQKLWTADEKGELNYFNQHWINYTGRSFEELKGWGWMETIHPEDAAGNREKWQQAVDTGNNFEFEQRIRNVQGEYRWHLVRGIARKDVHGKVLMWVGTNTDVHEQKTFAVQLEKRVKERTYELEMSNAELEQFVYVTSHDLQEPLRKIRMFTEMALSSMVKPDALTQKHMDKVSATALRMSTLLQELLNYTQLNKDYPFEETDLNEIVSQVLVDLELVISQKKAVVNCDRLPRLMGVPVQMHQLFFNLINNALKFSKEEAPPIINLRCNIATSEEMQQQKSLQQDVQHYHITVQDNGIGFNPKYGQQIFNIFQRLHSRENYSGTGIGLALCKRVVSNHYGVIYAESEPGKGASFHIFLPSNL